MAKTTTEKEQPLVTVESEKMPLSRELFMERFNRAQAELRADNATLANYIGCRVPEDFQGWFVGMSRGADAVNLELIYQKLVGRESTAEPLQFLEVACGSSLPPVFAPMYYYQDEGAAWFSRTLKKAFPDDIDIVVSDIQPTNFQMLLGLLDNNGVLGHICCLTPRFEGLVSPYFSIDANGNEIPTELVSFDHLELQEALADRDLERLEQLVSYQSWEQIRKGLEAGFTLSNSVLVDSIHPALEKDCFGLSYRPEVDMRKLSEHFEPQSFDFVFGRHLAPILEHFGVLPETRASLSEVLKEDGLARLIFDGGTDLTVNC